MIYSKTVSIVALFFLLVNYSFASDKACNSLASIPKYNKPPYPFKDKKSDLCLCEGELSKLRLSSPDGTSKIKALVPKGFSLVAACDVYEHPNGIEGSLFFNGEAILSGHITRIHGDPGAWFYFVSDKKEKSRIKFSDSMNKLKFDFDTSSFNAPDLVGGESCWRAKAEIKVNTFTLILGGSSESGSWPMEYSVMSVGKYFKCKP